MINEHEITNITNKWLNDAIFLRASDIHLEPYQLIYRIRLRIDGALKLHDEVSLSYAKSISVRLKIMAKLDISEQRLPQDGKLIFKNNTFRMSTIPIMYGEKIVLRLVTNNDKKLNIDSLGMTAHDLTCYKNALTLPQGLILVTGPTGSGKTASLYSGLEHINKIMRNICSVEDPIESPITGINQTQINQKAGLNFANFLRSLLRQDPDVIMIGEIRDKETAEIAMMAAQTGHLVLSTLHTNSSAEALIRLNQIGIKNYQIASSVKLIIAQRLVRKLCSHCKTASVMQINQNLTLTHFVANGCSKCIDGYYERIGIYEFLVITQQIKQLLLNDNHANQHQIEQLMKKNNNSLLSLSALSLIKQGITSLDEVTRVIGLIELEQ